MRKAIVAKRPNVLLIISDQWSTRVAPGCGESPFGVQTPAVDRLASEGMRFINSYSTFPLCGPARSTMFTGLYPHNHRVTDNPETFVYLDGKMPTRDDVATMGRTFKEAGYNTAYFGKEHAATYGWDGCDTFGTFKNTGGGWIGDGALYDPVFTRDAVEYLRDYDSDDPFYMVLSLINPHDICIGMGGAMDGVSFNDAISLLRDTDDRYLRNQPLPDLPSNFDPPTPQGLASPLDHSNKVTGAWSEHDWRRYVATFGLLTENTDWLIGLVLDELRSQGLEDDTIVMFTTDHGEMLGSHRMIAKTHFYEESAKTMMIVRQPGKIDAGTVNDGAKVGTIDMMPTLLDLAGIDLPDGMDGSSFKSACYGDSNEGFNELFSMNGWSRMLRFDEYKYILSEVKDQTYEFLFDLAKDPDEIENVYNAAGYEAVSQQAADRMTTWLAEQGIDVVYTLPPKTTDK
jgi:arylsulfatase A-like enzyme